jgi:glycosyltransferase involved in cell wall biosynthesis
VIGQLSVGGAERQLWEVVRALDPRFVPVVYCLADSAGPMAAELARLGVAVHTVGERGAARARALARRLRADGIHLVHAWLFIANGYAWAARWWGARQPLITSARNCKIQGGLSRLVNMLAFRASRCIVVNSSDVGTYIRRRYRAPAARIAVVHNGIDTERFHPGATGGDAPAQGPIVTVGRLVAQKNHALFLLAAARLVRDLPAARFVIVGDGPLRAALQEQAGDLGIGERVIFAGERHDVETLLRTASLFWLTSLWEGMPNVVLEALASGVPAIATDVGGVRDIIRHRVDGFVVSAHDADAFARCSIELLRAPAVWQRFSEAARARAQEFSTGRMVQTLSHIYEKVAGAAP